MKTIHYYAPLRAMLQKETEETDAGSVRDVLTYIKTKYGKDAFKASTTEKEHS